jgi:predicted DNA repair protein MutK
MKLLSIAGTAAMFLVGGGIIVHGVPALHHLLDDWTRGLVALAASLVTLGFNAVTGVVVGALAMGVVSLVGKLRPKAAAAS